MLKNVIEATDARQKQAIQAKRSEQPRGCPKGDALKHRVKSGVYA